jgi:hypothetical protein
MVPACEIPRPAGESAGLRNDATLKKSTVTNYASGFLDFPSSATT